MLFPRRVTVLLYVSEKLVVQKVQEAQVCLGKVLKHWTAQHPGHFDEREDVICGHCCLQSLASCSYMDQNVKKPCRYCDMKTTGGLLLHVMNNHLNKSASSAASLHFSSFNSQFGLSRTTEYIKQA